MFTLLSSPGIDIWLNWLYHHDRWLFLTFLSVSSHFVREIRLSWFICGRLLNLHHSNCLSCKTRTCEAKTVAISALFLLRILLQLSDLSAWKNHSFLVRLHFLSNSFCPFWKDFPNLGQVEVPCARFFLTFLIDKKLAIPIFWEWHLWNNLFMMKIHHDLKSWRNFKSLQEDYVLLLRLSLRWLAQSFSGSLAKFLECVLIS